MRLPRAVLVLLAPASALIVSCAPCAPSKGPAPQRDVAPAVAIAERLRRLGATPCTEDPKWLCHAVVVPLDHRAPSSGRTIRVAFAVHPAPAATRRGVLLRIVGGPGYSGVDRLGNVDKGVDPQLAATFDLLRFDLRGVKRSGALECKRAATTFYEGGIHAADTPSEATLLAKARTFASACVAEMGVAATDLPYYRTDQAAEDIEAIRAAIDEPRLHVYGMSYGTHLGQAYAAAHPDRVQRLVLDGVVDTTLGIADYAKGWSDGLMDLLHATLDACAASSACRAPFVAASPRAAYLAVARRLAVAPRALVWKKKDGSTAPRRYTRAAFNTTLLNAMATPETRRDFMSALAAAFAKDDYMPLLSLSYASADLDGDDVPESGTANVDPNMSDAVYFTFACNDFGAAAAERRAYVEGGRALWSEERIMTPYYDAIPCAFWPAAGPRANARLPRRGMPVLVVGATADSNTSFKMGEAVVAGIDDGYAVTVDGGHHVMWRRGNACVDAVVSAFFLGDAIPARRTRCSGTWIAE